MRWLIIFLITIILMWGLVIISPPAEEEASLILGAGETFSFVASATSSGATIGIPASAAAGDFALLFEGGRANPTYSLPSGWTLLQSETVTGLDVYLHGKVLESGDLGGSVGSIDGGTQDAKIILVFRPSGGSINTFTANDVEISVSQGDPTGVTINASGGSTPLIVIGWAAYSDAASTDPVLTTNSPALTTVSLAEGLVGYTIYNSSPSDHSLDKGDEGANNQLGGFYLTFTFAAAAVGTSVPSIIIF